jgi:hypothetical protein
VGDYLALALLAAAERTPRVRDDDIYVITGGREIARMRALLSRASAVTRDRDLLAGIAGVRRYVDRCARREWVPPPVLRTASGRALVALTGFLVAAAGVAAGLMHRFGTGLWVMLALAVLATLGLVLDGRVPRWKLNRWAQHPGGSARGSGGRPPFHRDILHKGIRE